MLSSKSLLEVRGTDPEASHGYREPPSTFYTHHRARIMRLPDLRALKTCLSTDKYAPKSAIFFPNIPRSFPDYSSWISSSSNEQAPFPVSIDFLLVRRYAARARGVMSADFVVSFDLNHPFPFCVPVAVAGGQVVAGTREVALRRLS